MTRVDGDRTREQLLEELSELHRRVADLQAAADRGGESMEELRRFKAVSDCANYGMVIVDLDGNVLYINDYFAGVHGYRPDELVGKNLRLFHSPEQLVQVERINRRLKETGSVNALEVGHRHRDGSTFTMLMNGVVITADDLTPAYMATTAIDITALQEAEAELRAGEEKLRRIYENIQDVYYEVAFDGSILEISPSIESMIGLPREDVIGRNVIETYADPEKRRELLSALEHDGSLRDYEVTLRGTGGRLVQCTVTSRLIRDEQGRPARIAGILHEITERKRSEELLRESEERLREQSKYSTLRADIWKLAADKSLSETELIQKLLDTIGPGFGVSRACYNTFVGDGLECVMEWCDDGVAPSLGASFPRFLSRYFTDESFIELTQENILDRIPRALRPIARSIVSAMVKHFDLESVLAVPYRIDEQVEGILSFDICRSQAVSAGWSDAKKAIIPDIVQILSRIITQKRTENALKKAHAELERRVVERTRELSLTNERLEDEIREHKRAEKALRESEEKFRSLAEEITDGVAVTDLGVHVWLNQAYADMFGFGKDELIGTGVQKLIVPEQVAFVKQMIRDRLSGRAVPAHYETIGQSSRGDHINMEVAAKVINFENRRAIQIVVRDITARRHAEAEKRKQETQMWHTQKLESLGILAGGIAHDFNNLLLSILGQADLALMELSTESPAWFSVEQIKTASLRAAELTNQLLAYSGKGRFVVQTIDLSRLVEEMMHLLKTVISKKAFFKCDLSPDLPSIEGAPAQIRQVVMNLITNASDALGDLPGVITISTAAVDADRAFLADTYLDDDLPAGRYVAVEVTDTGSGMEPETVARIFDPFFTTKFTGRGLGLAAVLGIVRGHGGAIKIDSRPGEGTRFQVLFPCATAAPDTVAETPEIYAPWQGEGTVLVVDDEETARLAASMMLKKCSFEVLTAADGHSAVEVFQQHAGEIVLVLLDMTMPEMDGVEALRRMQSIRQDVRAILSSGYAQEALDADLEGARFAGFMQKPYQMADLLAKVREVLNPPRP